MLCLPFHKQKKTTYWIPLVLASCVFGPLTASATPPSPSCDATARVKLEHTQNNLLLLKDRQEKTQQQVLQTYQNLFACQSNKTISMEQRDHCRQLQEEGAKQFQAMIGLIIVRHQAIQQLAHQTRQVPISCPAISDEPFPQITSHGDS